LSREGVAIGSIGRSGSKCLPESTSRDAGGPAGRGRTGGGLAGL